MVLQNFSHKVFFYDINEQVWFEETVEICKQRKIFDNKIMQKFKKFLIKKKMNT